MTDDLCFCGHVRRMHGSRPGLVLPDLRCRAYMTGTDCPCPEFVSEKEPA
jgi:hypothetical protein